MATPTLTPARLQAPTLPTTTVEALIKNISLSTTPEQKEKPEGEVTIGPAYATTEAETQRLSSMAERSVSQSKSADHPTQEVCIPGPPIQLQGGPR